MSVLTEIMRCSMVTPSTGPHQAKQDVTVCGVTIPKGDNMSNMYQNLINLLTLHTLLSGICSRLLIFQFLVIQTIDSRNNNHSFPAEPIVVKSTELESFS